MTLLCTWPILYSLKQKLDKVRVKKLASNFVIDMSQFTQIGGAARQI